MRPSVYIFMSHNRSIVFILMAYLMLAILYAVLVPPWETPDEPAHYRYVVQLAERWRPPADPGIRQRDSFCRDYDFTTSNYEWYHPAFGYLPLAVAYKVLSAMVPYSFPADFPPFNPMFCSDPFTNPNLFRIEAPYLLEIWRDQWGLLILRFLSSIWGLVVIYATYRIGQYMKMEGFEIVAASWVAFLPQFTFINASVRNDTVANAISALLLLFAIKMQRSSRHRYLLTSIMGLFLGAGILTKLTIAYLIPIAIAVVLFSAQKSWKECCWLLLCLLTPLFVLVGWYYLYYPEARAALAYTSTQLKINPRSFSWAYWKPFFPMFVELYFARFGWANVQIPSGWIKVVGGIWVLSFSVSMFYLWRKKETLENFTLMLLLWGLFLAFVGVIRYNFSVFQPQGRFLFPAIISWAILGTWGLSKVLPKQAKAPIGFAIAFFLLAFNLRSLSVLVSVYY